MRTSCSNCGLPLLISSPDAVAGLCCPRCHSNFTASSNKAGRIISLLTLSAAFLIGSAISVAFLRSWNGVDECIFHVRTALNL